MANKKSTGTRSTSRKTTTSKSRSNTTRNSKSKQTAGKKPAAVSNSAKTPADITFADYWHDFSKTRFFMPVMTVVVIVVLVLLDLLFTWDNYSKFFIALGFELIIAAVIWVGGMIFSLGSKKKDNEVN